MLLTFLSIRSHFVSIVSFHIDLLLINNHAMRLLQQKGPKTSYSRSPLHSNTYALRIRLSCKTLINQTMLTQVLRFYCVYWKFYNICVRSIFILFSACLLLPCCIKHTWARFTHSLLSTILSRCSRVRCAVTGRTAL